MHPIQVRRDTIIMAFLVMIWPFFLEYWIGDVDNAIICMITVRKGRANGGVLQELL
jgi:hypothetical protein